MGWKDDATKLAHEVKGSLKQTPFKWLKKTYEGLYKHHVEKGLHFADLKFLQILQQYWLSVINTMKKHPSKDLEEQKQNESDISRLIDIQASMLLQVIEPVRHKGKVDGKPILDMMALLAEFEERQK